MVTSSAFLITLKCLLDLHVELLNRQLYHTSIVPGTEQGCRRKAGVISGYSEPGGWMRFTRAHQAHLESVPAHESGTSVK